MACLLAFACFFFFFWDKVSLCSPNCPEIYYVNQTGFEVTEVHPSILSAGIKGIYHHISLSILYIPFPIYELNNIHVFRILIINLVHYFKVLIFHIKLKVDKISKDHFMVFFVMFFIGSCKSCSVFGERSQSISIWYRMHEIHSNNYR